MMQKMWQRLLGSLLAIILIVPFCFTTALAANGSNNIGEDTVNNVNVVVSYNSEKVSVAWYSTQLWKYTVSINYNCVANTNTRIYYSSISSNAHFLSYNCTIENVASNYIEIKTVNQEFAELEIYDTSAITFSGVIGLQSATKIADGTNSQLKTITDTYLSSMKTSLSALRTQVDNIAGYVDGLEGYVDGIEGKLDLAYTRLGEINTAMSVVEDLVNNVDATLGNISLEMEYFETQLRNIKTNLDTQINQLNTITLVLGDIIDAITGLNTTVQGIDNLIDTITWKDNGSNYGFLGYSTDGINKQILSSNVAVNANTPIYLHYHVFEYAQPTLIRLITPFYFSSLSNRYYTPELTFYTLYNNNLYEVKNYEAFCQVVFRKSYIYYEGATSGTYDLVIKVQSPYAGLLYSGDIGNTVSWIYGTDIEYWQLKSYINEFNFKKSEIASNELIADKLDDIIAAIGNVSITTEQIDNSTTTFDNSIETINNIHNTYNQQFNDVKNNVNNYDFSINNDMTSSKVGINDLFTRFYNIDFFRIPILVIMACAIFLIVLG